MLSFLAMRNLKYLQIGAFRAASLAGHLPTDDLTPHTHLILVDVIQEMIAEALTQTPRLLFTASIYVKQLRLI